MNAQLFKWLSLAIVFLSLFAIEPSSAERGPLPEGQWTEETELWLARAMVSEADWSSVDHAAIAWTLKRQWEARIEKNPELTFLDQIRAYCAGLKGAPRSERMKWVLALEDESEPATWPKDVAWPAYAPHWSRVRAFARAWAQGEIKDPCKRTALHWGGPQDKPGKDFIPVDCGLTRNIFYTLRGQGLLP